jgi:subtilase family serine protease
LSHFLRYSLFSATAAFLTLFALNAAAQNRLRLSGPGIASERVEFNIYLPLRNTDELDRLLEAQHTPGSPQFHKWLTPAEFRSRFGPSRRDTADLAEIMKSYGLTVTQTHSHGVRVQGTVSAVQRAFGTTMSPHVARNGNAKLVASAPITLPPALERMGARIVHFASLPEFQPQVRRAKISTPLSSKTPQNRYSPFGGYWFNDLKQAYDFPSVQKLDGTGRTIAIMAVSDFLDSDIAAYFAHESTPAAPISPPRIFRFPIGGGSPPFDPGDSGSIEAELDLQQAGGMAPGARLVLVNLPDASDGSFIDGYLTLVEANFADIVSTSFGGAEGVYTAAYNGGQDFTDILRVFDALFKQGNAQGITFVASSGDSGGLSLPPISYFTTAPQFPPVVTGKFRPGVQFFASSPHVTAVGGTNLKTTSDPPSLESSYVHEQAFANPVIPYDPYGIGNLVSGGVWGSGGGKSVVFTKPPYQELVETGSDMRTIPDISMQMGGCPGIATQCRASDSYTIEMLDGQLVGVIGTSVSAPDFAGILALKEQFLGGSRLGNVNYEIYAIAAAQPSVANSPLNFLHQGQPGSNGAFSTTQTGYNLVLGVGTPLVRNFIFAPELPPAGNPRTKSNP